MRVSVKNSPPSEAAIAKGQMRAGDGGLGTAIFRMTAAAGNAGADQTSNTAALPTVIAPSNSFVSMGGMKPAKMRAAKVARITDVFFKVRGSPSGMICAVSKRYQHFVA